MVSGVVVMDILSMRVSGRRMCIRQVLTTMRLIQVAKTASARNYRMSKCRQKSRLNRVSAIILFPKDASGHPQRARIVALKQLPNGSPASLPELSDQIAI